MKHKWALDWIRQNDVVSLILCQKHYYSFPKNLLKSLSKCAGALCFNYDYNIGTDKIEYYGSRKAIKRWVCGRKQRAEKILLQYLVCSGRLYKIRRCIDTKEHPMWFTSWF